MTKYLNSSTSGYKCPTREPQKKKERLEMHAEEPPERKKQVTRNSGPQNDRSVSSARETTRGQVRRQTINHRGSAPQASIEESYVAAKVKRRTLDGKGGQTDQQTSKVY